jgi:hypothetical protein
MIGGICRTPRFPRSRQEWRNDGEPVGAREGEVTIPPFIEDIGKGVTSGMYQSDLRADMTEAVVPRFDLIRLEPSHRCRPDLASALKLAWTFLRVSIKAGLDWRTGLLYWETLFKVLARNPRAAEAVVSMAALYVYYFRQSEFVIRTLEDRAAYIESYGEENYNQPMMAGQLIRVELERRSLSQQKTGSGEGITQPTAAYRMT